KQVGRHLALTVSRTGGTNSGALLGDVTVEVRDVNNNKVATDNTTSIQLSPQLVTAPGSPVSGYLAGLTTQTVSNGSVTFHTFVVNRNKNPSFDIQGITAGSPIRITAPNHGLVDGSQVVISGAQGVSGANGRFTVTKVDDSNFTLNGSTGTGTYTGGGTWALAVTGASGAGSPIVITSPNHGLSTGQQVLVSGVGGNTAANGTFTIHKIDDNTFSLDGTTGNGAYTPGTGSFVLTSSLYTLKATSPNVPVLAGVSPVFGVTSGTPTKLIITSGRIQTPPMNQPAFIAGQPLNDIVVVLQDDIGNVVRTNPDRVVVSLAILQTGAPPT